MPHKQLEYRGHVFVIEARPHAKTWRGHFHLLDHADVASEGASTKWVPLTPDWLTPKEAETNATEAAHAAIDALVDRAA
jgi:hypothetical protein